MTSKNNTLTIFDYQVKSPHPLRKSGGSRSIEQITSESIPLVTIFTVVRNRKNTLSRTIKSVISQTYTNIEYIIIDGNSSDGTVDVIKEYDRFITTWISEPDKNPADACNKAISLAHGKYLFWLSSDDWIDADFIEKAVTIFNKNCNYDFIFGGSRVFTNNIYIGTFYSQPFSGSSFESKDRKMPDSRSMMIKRDCFANEGLLNTYYLLACDLEFFERLVYKNYTGLFNGDLTVNYSTGGISSAYCRRTYERLHIANKYGYLSIAIINGTYPFIHFIASKVAARILPKSIFRFLRKIVRNPH